MLPSYGPVPCRPLSNPPLYQSLIHLTIPVAVLFMMTGPTIPAASATTSHTHFPYQALRQHGKYTQDRRTNLTPSIPDTKISNPDNTPLNPQNALPYKWICKLKLMRGYQELGHGTGFLINIPGSKKCVILTARHVLKDELATGIKITFPGLEEIMVLRTEFRYLDELNAETDYGIIILPDIKSPTTSCGFGFHAAMLDRGLLDADLSLVGYPGSQFDLWGSGGRTQSVDSKILKYLLPTSAGQSGSPVFIWYEGMLTVVGIHVSGEQRTEWVLNSAIRLTVSVMKTIVGWIGDYQYLGRSLCVQNNFLRRAKPGWVNAATSLEFGPAAGQPGLLSAFADIAGLSHAGSEQDEFAMFDFIPVHSYPEGSSIPYSSNHWVILCSRPNNDHVSVCIDPYSYGGVFSENGYVEGWPRGTSSIGTCEHLRESFILRRAPELVTLSKHNGDPDITDWGIRSVRYPNLPLRVMKALRFLEDGNDTWGLGDPPVQGNPTKEEMFKGLSFDISDASVIVGIKTG